MLGKKMYKHDFDEVEYKKIADWCNDNNCTIEDKDEYYEVVKVDNTELENQFKKQNLQSEINAINIKLSELRGIYVDGNKEYDVFVDGELVVMSETEFQNYSNELSNKRSELLQQYKELK
jgi:hypothetical protein|nr:MAG TPA: hypothetical protein [Caudoviricetes sp.]